MYRIPKHVDTQFTIMKLDMRSFFVWLGILSVVISTFFFWHTHGIRILLIRLFVSTMLVLFPWLFLSQKDIRMGLTLMFTVHRKQKGIDHWESEHNAFSAME